MGKKRFHIISHTHWDREWYLTFEQFRFRLVEMINHLMDLLENDPEFKVFHLDGQTIVLEDYLQVHPEQRDRLVQFIREGRILIGPWYLQNDEYLTSGESTIRNLQLGITQSRQLAEEMKIGYIPDQFGNISQMPQILQGFGIDNAVFARGYDIVKHKKQEFVWKGADGSEVLAVFMPNWYNNAQRIPDDPQTARKALDLIQDRIDPYRQTPNYLLMNGVDHLEAQENLSGILEKLRDMLKPGEELLHSTLPHHIEQVKSDLKNPQVLSGEMREGHDYHILAGTLSARVYLKQANVKATDLLEKWLEPLSVWVSFAGLAEYPTQYIHFLWKELMKNHPHDSICGCSQDAVHEHMMDRFTNVLEAGEELFKKQAELLSRQVDTSGMEPDDQIIKVFNPAITSQSHWMEADIDFLEQDQVESFSMRNAQGEEVSYVILNKQKTRKQRLSPINLPTELPVDRYTVGWLAEVPGQGYTTYQVIPGESGTYPDKGQDQEIGAVLENEYLLVKIHSNGSLSVLDKQSGNQFDRWLTLSDVADAGDLYVFTKLEGDIPVTTEHVEADIIPVLMNEHITAYEVSWILRLPETLNAEGTQRKERMIDMPIKAQISLSKGSNALDVRLEVDNHVKDHRLRVLFPLPDQPCVSRAGGQFDVVERSYQAGREYARSTNSHPNWKWVSAETDQGAGVAIYNRGLHEYELTSQGIELTLLRSVGTIFGRPNPLPHENDDNPLGQCPGKHVFEMAIRPNSSTDSSAVLAREAEAFHHGLRTWVRPVSEERWAAGRPWVQDSEVGELTRRPDINKNKPKLPLEYSFARVEGEGIVLSALKQDGPRTVVRFYNALNRSGTARVELSKPIQQAWRADMMEQPTEELQVMTGSVELEVEPKQIVTLVIE